MKLHYECTIKDEYIEMGYPDNFSDDIEIPNHMCSNHDIVSYIIWYIRNNEITGGMVSPIKSLSMIMEKNS